ncbi:hypothetical protein DICVIV_00056 [Dictyocaulus viviparus]|uniref:Protein phosphatase 1 regulatory subunit 21 N-terminal domain-containing protein n=1 Tax=Dictyocaulus viviparus TaxID=29172 RepID=A0A0D8Y9V0_DICVI|nr:hypothetical protein DICVIV_00056 [Dictyocaulus viviparus]
MSVSSVSFNTDVNIRYDRLSSEYARESIRELEIHLRKIEAENESLTFRNDQLTKRVESLQNELESSTNAKAVAIKKNKSLKKSKESRTSSQVEDLENRVSVLEEELQDKICQNMELANQINELKQRHTDELSSLMNEHSREVEDIKSRSYDSQSRENKADKPVKSVKPLEQSLEICESPSATPSPQPPPINDAYLQVAESIQNVLQGLSTFFELFYQRTQIYPFDATMESLPHHIKKWSTDVLQLCCAFSVVVQHCKEKLPELLDRLAIEENKITWCDSKLEKLNSAWCTNLCRLFEAMDSVCRVMEVNTSTLDIGDKVYAALEEGVSVVKELHITFTTRWAIESRFPTTTRKSCCIGTATSHCLSRLVNDMRKLAARVYAVNGLLLDNDKDTPICLDREVLMDSLSCNDSGNSANKETQFVENPSPCREGVDTCDFGCQTDESSNISCNSQNNLGELLFCNSEVSSEQMMVPFLDSVDYLKAKVSTLESERESHLVDLSLLRRKLAHFGAKEVNEAGYSEVEILKQVNRERLRAVADDLQVVQCAANYYKGECMILLRKNHICMKEKQALEESVQNMTLKVATLTDELKLVRHNYNEQLSQMTEHIADLNGRLADIEKGKKEKQLSSAQQRTGLRSLFMK